MHIYKLINENKIYYDIKYKIKKKKKKKKKKGDKGWIIK